MTNSQALGWILGAAALGGITFLLHHLFLWMESKGWLYYWHRQREGSRWKSLIEAQDAAESSRGNAADQRQENPQVAKNPLAPSDHAESGDAPEARSGATS